MDNLVAGRTAGAMLEGLVKARNGAIAVFGGTSLYAELRQRVEGCREILETRLGGVQLLPTTWDVEHEGEAKAATLSLLAEEPELLGIYVAGGGLFGVADALIETGRAQSTVVVGHDLAGRMRALLLDRVVNVAICQDPVHQVRRAVRTAASLASGGKVEQSELLARVEIYIPESVVSAG
jgi:LacI family transcriptional regulator